MERIVATCLNGHVLINPEHPNQACPSCGARFNYNHEVYETDAEVYQQKKEELDEVLGNIKKIGE